MMRWVIKNQRVCWLSVGTCLLGLGCGGSESDSLFEEPPPAAPVMAAPPAEVAPEAVEPMVRPVSPPPSEENAASEMTPLTPVVED